MFLKIHHDGETLCLFFFMGFKIMCNTINDLMSIVTAITCTHSYNHNAELNPVTYFPSCDASNKPVYALEIMKWYDQSLKPLFQLFGKHNISQY